jgi:WD40 repeat protein
VLTASFDGNATVHDIATGEVELVLYGDVFPGGGNVYYPMYSADFDDEGERIVTAQDSGVVELWDAITGEELGPCCSVGWIPWGAAFMPGGDRIAAIYFDNTARLWDAVGSGWEEAHVFEETLSLAYSEDGTRLATVDRDGATRVWDAATYQTLRAWDTGLVNSLALSGDGATLVTAGVDGGITVWDVATGATLVTIPDADAGSLALGADDSVILSGGSDGSASVWRLADGSFLGSVVAHADSVTTVEMAPDGQIATTSFDGTARVFECEVCSASLDEVVARAEAALVEPAG